MSTKKDEDLLDKIKSSAASTAHVIGKEAGGLAVNAAIKGGALAMTASKMSMKAVTKVAGYGATTEMRAEVKCKDKEIKELKKIIEEQNILINQLKEEINSLK